MAFIIEWLASSLFKVVVYRVLGWDEEKYNEIIHSKKQFVFTKNSIWYLIWRYGAFILISFLAISFLAVFFFGLYNRFDYVPAIIHGKLSFNTQYDEYLISDSWTLLLFGIFFLLDLDEQRAFLFLSRKKTTKFERMNLRASCHFPYWIVLMLDCCIRIILSFTLDNATVLMNWQNVVTIAHMHPTSAGFVTGLSVLYYLTIIGTSLLFIISLLILLTHKHLLKPYLVECVKNKTIASKLLRLSGQDAFHWDNLVHYYTLTTHLKQTDECVECLLDQ